MPTLVTLRQAKQHLRLPLDVTADDTDLTLKVDIAEALCLDYVKQNREDNDAWAAIVDAWTAETAPRQVIGAILYATGEVYRFRGDDDTSIAGISARVRGMLDRLRDPCLS